MICGKFINLRNVMSTIVSDEFSRLNGKSGEFEWKENG